MKRARSETTMTEADTQMSEAGTRMQLSDPENDNAALTEQQDQTSHPSNPCDAIDNGTARDIAQAAKTMQPRKVRIMKRARSESRARSITANDDAALTEQQDQTSHLVNQCDAIDNETARETAQPAKTKQSHSERFMWAYFNSWVTGDANDVAPWCTVVPMTRRLSHEEEAMLVEYFCDPGPKCIPSGLPHAHKGKSCVLLTAQATKEMVKLTADKGIAHVALVRVTTLECGCSVARARCMYVKRVKVMGKEELIDLCTRAGLGGC
jgi:hypothetical protein